jgi:hypothetical protein
VPAELSENHAVIDRIDAGVAVPLIGANGGQRQLDAALLPNTARDGDVVEISFEDDAIVVGEIDHGLTDARHTDAQQRLARIRKGRPSDRFG